MYIVQCTPHSSKLEVPPSYPLLEHPGILKALKLEFELCGVHCRSVFVSYFNLCVCVWYKGEEVGGRDGGVILVTSTARVTVVDQKKCGTCSCISECIQ